MAVIIMVVVDTVLVVCELLLDLGKCPQNDQKEQKEEQEQEQEEPLVPLILHCLSLAVLSLFLLELFLKLFAFRLQFFSHKVNLQTITARVLPPPDEIMMTIITDITCIYITFE